MIDFLSSSSSSVFKAQKKKRTRIDEQAAYANQIERKIIDGNRDKYIYTGTQTIFKDN
jgi:hypothetical protein